MWQSAEKFQAQNPWHSRPGQTPFSAGCVSADFCREIAMSLLLRSAMLLRWTRGGHHMTDEDSTENLLRPPGKPDPPKPKPSLLKPTTLPDSKPDKPTPEESTP